MLKQYSSLSILLNCLNNIDLDFLLFSETSPRSSPRTPLENSHTSSQHSHFICKTNHSFEQYSSRSVEPSFEEDDNYSTVDCTNILQNDSSDLIEEEDKYSTIKESKSTSEFVEEDKYSTISNTLASDRTDISNNEDEKYTTVTETLKDSILQNDKRGGDPEGRIDLEDIGFREIDIPQEEYTTVNRNETDFPDYAVVDLELKKKHRAEREDRERKVKEIANCEFLSCFLFVLCH